MRKLSRIIRKALGFESESLKYRAAGNAFCEGLRDGLRSASYTRHVGTYEPFCYYTQRIDGIDCDVEL